MVSARAAIIFRYWSMSSLVRPAELNRRCSMPGILVRLGSKPCQACRFLCHPTSSCQIVAKEREATVAASVRTLEHTREWTASVDHERNVADEVHSRLQEVARFELIPFSHPVPRGHQARQAKDPGGAPARAIRPASPLSVRLEPLTPLVGEAVLLQPAVGLVWNRVFDERILKEPINCVFQRTGLALQPQIGHQVVH